MSTGTVASVIRKRSDWAKVTGVVTAIIGVFMVLYPLHTATATTIFFGWSLLIAAFAHVVFAFFAPSPGPFVVKILLAILYAVGGVGLILNPVLGVAALTLALGTMLLIQAGIEFGVAILYRAELPVGWMVLDSLVSLALGLMLVFQWPFGSAWVIGTMVGFSVMMAGITRVVVASMVHDDAVKFERLANAS